MPLKLVIVDYGAGNLNSVWKILNRLDVKPVISSEAGDISSADKLILPGVGHFGMAMSNLKKFDLLDPLHKTVLIDKKPILGICLGMQLMAKKSEEGDSEGLGWLDAEVVKIRVSDNLRYKIPHIGWNRIIKKKNGRLLKNISESSEFYFVHSYQIQPGEPSDLLSESRYESVFTSAVERANIFGVQFHPEKSRDEGARLIKNFIEL